MKKFNMIDENFTCINCNKKISKLNYTARNHCNFCLHSIHIDNNPGDRNNKCKGILKPIGITKHKDTYKIIFKCERCSEIKRNIMAKDDNMDLIISLSSNVH